ncbi:MAG: Coq4 family protein [Ferruginibacter sp.]
MLYSYIVKIRSAVLVFLTHSMALPILKMVRKPEIFPYSKKDLQGFKEGSLGKDLVQFIHDKNIELLPYYARHDIKHILLDYDTTDDGEVCLQCFMLGNSHISFPVLATVFYGYATMPEHWSKFRQAYKRGKDADCLEKWAWFEILDMDTQLLKNIINYKILKHDNNLV